MGPPGGSWSFQVVDSGGSGLIHMVAVVDTHVVSCWILVVNHGNPFGIFRYISVMDLGGSH